MRGTWLNNQKGVLLLGGLATLLTLLLMGAVRNEPPLLPVAMLAGESRAAPLSSTGRYQIATWEASGGYGAFVLDTATGITKIAYSSGKGVNGKNVNNLGKTFSQMSEAEKTPQ